jgi:hypothetical protein
MDPSKKNQTNLNPVGSQVAAFMILTIQIVFDQDIFL